MHAAFPPRARSRIALRAGPAAFLTIGLIAGLLLAGTPAPDAVPAAATSGAAPAEDWHGNVMRSTWQP